MMILNLSKIFFLFCLEYLFLFSNARRNYKKPLSINIKEALVTPNKLSNESVNNCLHC